MAAEDYIDVYDYCDGQYWDRNNDDMPQTDRNGEAIRLLTSIDAHLARIAAALAPPVNDAKLDSAHGDPLVKVKDPRDWSGDSMKGRHFSECPPEYLDLLAERFDYFASKETDEKKARYNRLDAERARGWAQRLRSGWKPQKQEPDYEPRW